jgi:hypothetical protein
MTPNPENYGTLEACQAFVKAGIVMETDCYYGYSVGEGWCLLPKDHPHLSMYMPLVPAPSLAEMWRELPIEFVYDTNRVFLFMTKKRDQKTYCGYAHNENAVCGSVKKDVNPTDAMIHLRIWLKERGEKENV